MNKRISIYQIYYLENQLELLDPSFIPYDNRENFKPDWREYYIFEKEFLRNTLFHDVEYAGFFSWKFNQKSNITGIDFLKFVEENPGYDLYLINPFPLIPYQFNNIWEQGEKHHPGIIKLTEFIFREIGIPISSLEKEQIIGTFSFCNYWAANKKFWNRFIDLGYKIKYVIENRLPDDLKSLISQRADTKINSNYIPFIYERIVTTIINSESNDIKYLSYTYTDMDLIKKKPNEVKGFLSLGWNYNKNLNIQRRIHFLKKKLLLKHLRTKCSIK